MGVHKKCVLACCAIATFIVLCHYQQFWNRRYVAPKKPTQIKTHVVHEKFNRWKRLLANRTYSYSKVLQSPVKPFSKLKMLRKGSGSPSRIDLHIGNSSIDIMRINRTCFFFENGSVYKPVPWDKEVLKIQHCSRRLPDAIIFGVRQCGTSELDFYLRTHPDVAFTESEEMHFFGSPKERKGMDWYRSQMMMSKASQVTMEKTPKYFIRPDVPKTLYEVLGGSTKLLLVLRDPVERAIYDFLQLQLLWSQKGSDLMNRWAYFNGSLDDYYFLLNSSFETTVLKPSGEVRQENAVVYIGCYAFFLERWLKYFPPSQIFIVDHKQLKDNPVSVLMGSEKFLGISPYFSADRVYFNEEKQLHCLSSPFNHCADVTLGRVLPEVDQSVIKKLKDFYRPYNEKLCYLFPQTCKFSWM